MRQLLNLIYFNAIRISPSPDQLASMFSNKKYLLPHDNWKAPLYSTNIKIMNSS